MFAMRPWLILVACGLASLPSLADDKSAAPLLAPPQDKVEPPTLAPLPEKSDAAAPDQALAPSSSSLTSPGADSAQDKSTTDSAPADPNAVSGATYGAASFKDTMGGPTKSPRDVQEDSSVCFAHADYLRQHNDPILAASYLKEIATNGSVLPQDRARALIELADTLESHGEEAEALCWLKIWCELFPGRREFAGVAYRIATFYREMDMPDLARDAYYLSLAHAVNQGQMIGSDDLANYNKLTTATLWGLAANEYQAGQWSRAAELFDRYRREAAAATPFSIEKSEFLQADCYYQLRQADDAIKLYADTLAQHPFNPLAPQARLRLYHLYVMKNAPEKAQAELESLVWTVRTVWPKNEAYWQKQTAQLLLAINQKNADVLPPLVKESAHLLPSPEGKSWQEAINHYDALVSYQVVKTGGIADCHADSFSKIGDRNSLEEENDLLVMNNRLNQVLPPAQSGANP
jgi:tetratricopeptide (TPR) repeat protein